MGCSNRRLLRCAVFVAPWLGMAAGCGADAAAEPNAGTDASVEASAAAGGSVGAGGSAPDAALPVPLDAARDAGPLTCPVDGRCFDNGDLELCCTDDGECGAMYPGRSGAGCVSTSGGGKLDPTCPDAAEGPGCCMPNGNCGAFYSRAFGCIDRAVFPGFPPEPMPCGELRDAGAG